MPSSTTPGLPAVPSSRPARSPPGCGATHQLRVHLRWLGHPILGDPLYAGRARGSAPRRLLHARRLVILLPEEAQPRAFTAPLPPGFAPPEAIPETRTEG